MTQTGYSNAIVNALLGWLKGLASWVLKLFDLAGSGGSPLLWLSEHWLQLLIFLLILGVAMDWLIWMIRWRPYWVWFRKKRIIVNDERFLNEDDLRDAERTDGDDPVERRYTVPSTVVKRRPARSASGAKRRAPEGKKAAKPRRPRIPELSPDELFEVKHGEEDYSDFYEDEVFNVSNLPEAQTSKHGRRRRR